MSIQAKCVAIEGYKEDQRRSFLSAYLVAAAFVAMALVGAYFANGRVLSPPTIALAVAAVACFWMVSGPSRLNRLTPPFALASVLLGGIPVLCALGASHIGHVCMPGGCTSLCVPLCALGGGVAGLWLLRMALATKCPMQSFALGALLVAATGCLGCSCVGLAGAGAMAATLAVTGLPVMWLRRL